MTEPHVELHLRRPDGSRLDGADAARMEPGTTLVVAIDIALPEAALDGSSPVLATVIGWAVPAAARNARPMLAEVCKIANAAANDFGPDDGQVKIIPRCDRPAEAVDSDVDGVCRACGRPAEAHRTAAEIAMEATQ